MAKSHLELATPTEANQTVAPARRPGAELQTREHLTPDEVELLVAAAKANRHGHRDATMILVAFRHGLRAAEVCDLRWNQVEFDAAILHVRQQRPASKLKAHPHMLREACGYALANRGYDTRAIQVWLGHRFRRCRCVNRYQQPSPAAPAAA